MSSCSLSDRSSSTHQCEKALVRELGKYVSNDEKYSTRYDPEVELQRIGRQFISFEKYLFIVFMLSLNFLFIFVSWYWQQYYYVTLPFISLTVTLNTVMCFSIIFFSIKHRIRPEPKIFPENPETIVHVLPCYNETFEELTESLDSVINQINVDQHKRTLIVVCDGKVRGPGMEKTSADYLMEDIFVHRTSRRLVRGAYRAWDRQMMSVEIQKGIYKGMPYLCIIKQQNQGKRDGLILLRSFLYKFNLRHTKPKCIFSPTFFGEMSSFLIRDSGIEHVDHLIGMDGDTTFADDCVYELLEESRYPHTVGVCGYVAIDFRGQEFNLWKMYQFTEYTISQGLRRLHQSIVTHKVSCLPGCCQLLRICEETCSDHLLVDLFGYCPKPNDGTLKQIRATASEDRNHVCLMLTEYPKAQTRQALRAKAYTDVPASLSVFLSQRRRWTLGATSNDLMLVFAPGIQWFERILAISNILTWVLNFFIIASIGCLIKAALSAPWWILLAFSSVMIIPFVYYILIVVWLPESWTERAQYLIGITFYVSCGPFMNIFVLSYSLWNIDSFGWGKTRRVVEDASKPLDSEETLCTSETAAAGVEVIAIIGCPAAAVRPLEHFGRAYRVVAFDPSEQALCDALDDLEDSDDYRIETTTDPTRLSLADMFIIAGPISRPSEPMDSDKDLRETLDLVYRHAKSSALIVVDMPARPGTINTTLTAITQKGFVAGYVTANGHSPPGRGKFDVARLITALDRQSLNRVERVYHEIYRNVVPILDVEVAEKLQALEEIDSSNDRKSLHCADIVDAYTFHWDEKDTVHDWPGDDEMKFVDRMQEIDDEEMSIGIAVAYCI